MVEDLEKEQLKDAEQDISRDVKDLVIARLDIFPSDRKIAIGSSGEFSKEELIEHVKKGDEIGNKAIEVELAFLRALKDGDLLREVLVPDEYE